MAETNDLKSLQCRFESDQGYVSEKHLIFENDIRGPFPTGTESIYLGMGCFWGAEKKLWVAPGVVCTAVGYMGGHGEDPLYPVVCTGTTGHAEIVRVVFDPTKTSVYNILKIFWENHDPTQGNRQGNDIGTQYRSAIYWTNSDQERVALETARVYNEVLLSKGFDPVTTELESAEGKIFWYAEEYHQQYLIKNPNGYDCHAHTGIDLPEIA
jgi:peptide-methionine (S)-S-oxide reductase